jgi:hypothetical protein
MIHSATHPQKLAVVSDASLSLVVAFHPSIPIIHLPYSSRITHHYHSLTFIFLHDVSMIGVYCAHSEKVLSKEQARAVNVADAGGLLEHMLFRPPYG